MMIRRSGLLAITATVVLSSCATVINETDEADTTVETVASVVVTTIPQGDIVTLLSQLVDSASGLGNAIADQRNAIARQQAADAEAIWSALKPQLLETGIDVVEDLQRMVTLIQTAVDRRRPADADKAFRFISIIAEEIPSLL
jgi:transcriptional regulator of nitric oxide reductase